MEFQYKSIKRNRIVLGCALVVIISFGLLSRSTHITLPVFFVKYAGDTLWSSMVYVLLCMLFPNMKIRYLIVSTLLFSYMIEFSQMLTFPWLMKLRTTPLRFILGQGFVWSDLICYTIGCVGIACIDYVCLRRRISNE